MFVLNSDGRWQPSCVLHDLIKIPLLRACQLRACQLKLCQLKQGVYEVYDLCHWGFVCPSEIVSKWGSQIARKYALPCTWASAIYCGVGPFYIHKNVNAYRIVHIGPAFFFNHFCMLWYFLKSCVV